MILMRKLLWLHGLAFIYHGRSRYRHWSLFDLTFFPPAFHRWHRQRQRHRRRRRGGKTLSKAGCHALNQSVVLCQYLVLSIFLPVCLFQLQSPRLHPLSVVPFHLIWWMPLNRSDYDRDHPRNYFNKTEFVTFYCIRTYMYMCNAGEN